MQNQDSHTKNQTSLNYGDYKTDELVFQSNRKELEHVININSTKIKYIYLNQLLFVGTVLFCGFKRGVCFVGTMLFVCTHYSKVFQVKCLYRS